MPIADRRPRREGHSVYRTTFPGSSRRWPRSPSSLPAARSIGSTTRSWRPASRPSVKVKVGAGADAVHRRAAEDRDHRTEARRRPRFGHPGRRQCDERNRRRPGSAVALRGRSQGRPGRRGGPRRDRTAEGGAEAAPLRHLLHRQSAPAPTSNWLSSPLPDPDPGSSKMNRAKPVTQVLGEGGEPCATCGAPLAADQRYCLNCGQRRGRRDRLPRAPVPRQEATAAAPAAAGASRRPQRLPPSPAEPPTARLRAARGGWRDRGARPDAPRRRADRQGNGTRRPPPRRRFRFGEGGSTKDTAARRRRKGRHRHGEPKTAKARAPTGPIQRPGLVERRRH